jgi:phosphoserine aminotransferase
MKIHNFGAGPSILPQEVFEKASKAVIEFGSTGLSILEISHRSSAFEDVLDKSIIMIRTLLQVPDDYDIIFTQGGASTHFSMIPYNMLPQGAKAAYLDTGVWSSKAIKEAEIYGNPVVVASSKDSVYNHIPTGYTIPDDAVYFHITTNNTIYGTQIHELPKSPIPIIADMSSDIFSKQLDVSQYGIIYAGAQKNLGPAGVTIAIIKKGLLNHTGRKLSTMWDYQTHIDNKSNYNTPPVFAIYVCMLTLQWLSDNGGIAVIEQKNNIKAKTLYDEIDRNSKFKGHSEIKDRSKMNATFVCLNSEDEKIFKQMCIDRGIIGIEGHRTTGGFRASLYNALPLESVQALVKTMQDFEQI